MMCSHNQAYGSYRIFSIFESFDHDVFSSTHRRVAARVIQFFISFVNDCAPLVPYLGVWQRRKTATVEMRTRDMLTSRLC